MCLFNLLMRRMESFHVKLALLKTKIYISEIYSYSLGITILNTYKGWIQFPLTSLVGIYVLCLFRWDGHCCSMHCNLFKIYCAPPNLGITRTWICRLNFAQKPILQDWGSLTSWKKFIDLGRVWTREPWISRRARYPETTEADLLGT